MSTKKRTELLSRLVQIAEEHHNPQARAGARKALARYFGQHQVLVRKRYEVKVTQLN